MVNRKIVICSESLRLPRVAASPDEKFSIDSEAIIGLLKNNIEALQAGSIGIEAAGFGGKDEFMKEVPFFVLSKFAEYRHRNQAIEIFIIAIRDADTSDGKKISGIRRKLTDKIRKLIGAQEFNRVHIMFAVQAIEAWILADEQKLNEYLGVTNKVKHINVPEKIEHPKQAVQNLFVQCGRKYSPQQLQDLLPQLQVSELRRCKHFNELYTCVQKIVEGAAS